ncbi:unnamed protein product [Rotaria sp. Silwood1]|nr:unnamed protein product [Rotaria sp. Silwood1]CAF0964604.1 unnamed protein product [Rotaria sp. Silwood1]CAF3408349.1 unnamed protein product [Rotaria sp. Silwood1]CAF4604266.1 unnamed protein product [Rotaria sp. Silwood1]
MDTLTSTPPPISSTTTIDGDKLSGKLIIKAQLGNDIRKMMIHNEDLTLNELVLMMERVFAGKISNSDEITIKYLDNDGDKITLLNDSDLTVALHFHKLLRLFVFINGDEQTNTNSTDKITKEDNLIDAKTFRSELQQIRNSVQTILDRLQLSTNEVAPPPPPSTTTTTTAPTSTVVSGTAREFDPCKSLQQQQQRSATPDSTTSNLNRVGSNEHQTAPTVDTQQVESTHVHQMPPSTFPPMQMSTPHFMPTGFNNDQQAKSNVFGPPPTTFPGMPPLPNNTSMPYPPSATSMNNNTPPTSNATSTPPPSSVGQPSGFIGQQAPPLPQQGGFYGQQQALFQQRPPLGNFNANNTFGPPQTAPPSSNSQPATINPSFMQPPPSNSSPATINPSFMQPLPPMASQQPYGTYPPQNSYYNPVQQYPNTS